ncbi:MAG: alpha/beta hydrolase [Blastocatellia bacterium]
MNFLTLQQHRIEYVRLASAQPQAGAPPILFLHEGLGSVALWRDFPQRIADATGCEAIVYSRYGYGQSDSLQEDRTPRFMHDEALQTLPALCEQLQIEKPIFFGHSDGGSIALIAAGGGVLNPRGVIVLAPHVFVEEFSLVSIRQARENYLTTDLKQKLSRYHHDPDSAFWGWNNIWLHPEFRAWNLEEYLPCIACPILAMQGEDDEYGTMEQIERIAAQAHEVELLKLSQCKHSPHRDQPEAVIQATERFVTHCLSQ